MYWDGDGHRRECDADKKCAHSALPSAWIGRIEKLERAKGIEPSYSAWEADVLPLNYARNFLYYTPINQKCQWANEFFSWLQPSL